MSTRRPVLSRYSEHYIGIKMEDQVARAPASMQSRLEDLRLTLDLDHITPWIKGLDVLVLENGYQAPDLAIMIFTSCKLAGREFERFIRLSKTLKAILILATNKPNPDSVLKVSLERPDRFKQSYVTSPTLLDPGIPATSSSTTTLKRCPARDSRSRILQSGNR